MTDQRYLYRLHLSETMKFSTILGRKYTALMYNKTTTQNLSLKQSFTRPTLIHEKITMQPLHQLYHSHIIMKK